MLHSEKKWTYLEMVETDELFQKELSISPVTERLLKQRGIMSSEEAKRFLRPELAHLQDPLDLADMERTKERIFDAIDKGERILVYGDYDADGVTSTTVLLETLQELGAFCDFYIPNRFTEGYGPNEGAFRQAKESGVSVIITVDNGIAAVHEAQVAKELGIDLIITDHHEIQEEVPDAYAILHPKCAPDYEFKELAGVGVAFKLAEVLLGYFPEKFLDLVAIGTVADMVPLVSENRILTKFGLDQLTRTKRPGLMALKEIANVKNPVSEQDIGFLIGPRLNAVGRLQDADLAVDLLMCNDFEEAKVIAEEVQNINVERQRIVGQTTKEVDALIKSSYETLPGVLIVSGTDWNEGVLGIVASQLVRKYNRPAIVLRKDEENNRLKGSARSIPPFDFFEHCMSARELFTNFGGHSQAAGMMFPIDSLPALQAHLDEAINTVLEGEEYIEELPIAVELDIEELTESLVGEVEQLAPFGMANQKPLFELKAIPTDIRQLGNEKKHLKMQFSDGGHSIEGIGFGKGDLYEQIAPETTVSIVGELGINEWNGFRKVQIIIRDLEVREWQLFDYRGKKDLPAVFNTDIDDGASLALYNTTIPNVMSENATLLSYADLVGYETDLSSVQTVFLYDLPLDLKVLQSTLQNIQPERIYTFFYVADSSYLNAPPNREEFTWFYKLLLQWKQIDLAKDTRKILQHTKWSEMTLEFIIDVFVDLAFISKEGERILPVEKPEKRELDSSIVYQQRIEQAKVEQKLYYSTYAELKRWFEEASELTESIEED